MNRTRRAAIRTRSPVGNHSFSKPTPWPPAFSPDSITERRLKKVSEENRIKVDLGVKHFEIHACFLLHNMHLSMSFLEVFFLLETELFPCFSSNPTPCEPQHHLVCKSSYSSPSVPWQSPALLCQPLILSPRFSCLPKLATITNQDLARRGITYI